VAEPPETRRVHGGDDGDGPPAEPVSGRSAPPETRRVTPETRRVARDTGTPRSPRPADGTPPTRQVAGKGGDGGNGGPGALGAPPPAPGSPELPPTLAERFEVVDGTPPLRGGEAWVWRVTDKKRIALLRPEYALKVYRRGEHPSPEVRRRRAAMRSRYLLKLRNSDVAGGEPWEFEADGQSWELTDWVAGGTLHDLIGRHPEGMPEPLVRAIVGQLADALHAVHGAKVVHRDVKPANILIRKDGGPEEIKVALTDFGAACAVDRGLDIKLDLPRTTEYSAPEIFLNAVTAPSDCWSLGMTVAEMATGQHPLAGHSAERIPLHINQYTVPVPEQDEVPARIRLLCRGLLVHKYADRWEDKQVADWLNGETPPVADERGPSTTDKRPFVFDGTPYRDRASLATVLAAEANWGKAARDLFGPGGGRKKELLDWLSQFHDQDAADSPGQLTLGLARVARSPDASLLLVLRSMYPGLPASYLGRPISVEELANTARWAMSGPAAAAQRATLTGAPGDGRAIARKVIEDLWTYRLLLDLDGAPGGAGLQDTDARWRASEAAWDTARARVNGRLPAVPQRQADQLVWPRWRGTPLRAWLLWIAADPANARKELRQKLASQRRLIRANLGRQRLDWFDELAARASVSLEASLAAYAVTELATGESEAIRATREAAAQSQRERKRLWNRRENWRSLNRPVALGWAAAAVGIVAVGWVALLLFSSGVRFASAAEINEAWIFMTIALLLQAGIEFWLAAVIGGPYHPDYSLISWLAPRAGRTGRAFRHRGTIGALVVAGVFAALLGATITVPFLLPLILVPTHAGWAYARHHRWREDYRRRREHIVGAGTADHASPRPRSGGWWQWLIGNRTETSA
jgi:eukaryotic-like serine/threonine-protein kinase